MIVDSSVLVDAVADSGARGDDARTALRQPGEKLVAPGLLAVEVLSALRRLAVDESADFSVEDVPAALDDAEALGIEIEATPWEDVRRAWELSQGSVRYADGVFVAAAERHRVALVTSDGRLARSGAQVRCQIIDLTSPSIGQ